MIPPHPLLLLLRRLLPVDCFSWTYTRHEKDEVVLAVSVLLLILGDDMNEEKKDANHHLQIL